MNTETKECYSGKNVIKAGECFLCDESSANRERMDWAMNVLSYWRFQHEKPLNLALTMLEDDVRKFDKNAIFAKRLKRHPSIVTKLKRFPKMKLKNMQDIGGCRTIVSSQKKLYQIVRELRKKPQFKGDNGDIRYKDYIDAPKPDGYRGYHLIGRFGERKQESKLIELQLRTEIQHDWATALEIVDLFTGQALKSDIGEEKWKTFFKLVSEHFSIMEEIHLFRLKDEEEQLIQYEKKLISDQSLLKTGSEIHNLSEDLSVIKKLEAFSHSLRIADKHISEKEVDGYVLLKVDIKKSTVELIMFREEQNADAEMVYLSSEKEASQNSDLVVALVSTTAVGGVKEAYPNYFADSYEFVKYLMVILRSQCYRKPSLFEKLLKMSGL